MRILQPDQLDDLQAEFDNFPTGCKLHVAIDTETTRITPARGYNPFYGVRAAMVQLSWNDPYRETQDVAIPLRMKRGIKAWPELPKGNKKEALEKRRAWREAHKLWAGHKDTPGDADVVHFEALEGARELIEIEDVANLDVDPIITLLNHLTDLGVVWVMKNMKFDILMLAADGWRIPPVEQLEDAEVLSHLTEDKPWQKGVPVGHKLEQLAERHLGRPPEASEAMQAWFKDLRVKDDMKDYSAVPLSISAVYGCQDTRDTLDLFHFFIEKMKKQDEGSVAGKTLGALYREEVQTITNLVMHTISDGCAVNQVIADRLLEKYEGVRQIHEHQLFDLAGQRTIEWGSTDQLETYLFNNPPEGLGLPVPEFAVLASGKRSTSKAVLEALDTPITNELLKWRQADTFVTSFLEPIARFNIDGFIHPDFWLTTVRTGRMSCSHPNFQNRPKDEEVRSMFVPRPGYVFLDFDYDQIEMRLAAHYAQRVVDAFPELSYQSWWNGKPSRWITSRCYKAEMADMFNEDPEYDPHMTMVERSGLPRKRTQTGETTAKEANFAILYGVGIRGMGRNFGWDSTKAKKIKGAWRKSYPEIVHLQHFLNNTLYERGFIANEFGRRYYVDKDKTYLGLNYLIQGCAGDLMKRAMNRVYALLRQLRDEYEGGQPLYVSNTVHDELVLEVREDLLTDELARRVAAEMTVWERNEKPMFCVPITVGCEVSESDWGSLREYEL